MIVTLNCKECSNYFRVEAFEPEDLTDRICESCEEQAEKACTHDHVHMVRFDVGRCEQTGYHDAGEILVCNDCGFEEVA